MNKHLPAYIILSLLAFYIVLSELGYKVVHKNKLNTIVELSDTTYQQQEKAFNVSIPESKVIIIDQSNKWKAELSKTFGTIKVENEILKAINDSLVQELNLYSDTLSDENLDIYYNSLVHGNLLSSNVRYKLKVPTVITNTKTISTPVFKSSWIFQTEAGGNPQQFSNLSLGIQHISKKGFTKGYRYNFLKNTHNISLGVRVF